LEELLRNLLENSNGLFAYGSVFGILVACGLGVPLPEDISLILGGFLSHKGAANLPVMMMVGFLGIVVGDSIIFAAGRRVGSRVGLKPGGLLGKVITPEKRAQVEALFAKHGEKIVMIARFLPGVRAVTYFTAGSVRMSYWRFIAFDGLAALASAPVFVYLGYYFGDRLQQLIEALKAGQVKVMVGLAVVIVGYLLVKRIRARREAAAQVAAPVPLPVAVAPIDAEVARLKAGSSLASGGQ
jgi:membrane protein DedA with SNARE-associated domain